MGMDSVSGKTLLPFSVLSVLPPSQTDWDGDNNASREDIASVEQIHSIKCGVHLICKTSYRDAKSKCKSYLSVKLQKKYGDSSLQLTPLKK